MSMFSRYIFHRAGYGARLRWISFQATLPTPRRPERGGRPLSPHEGIFGGEYQANYKRRWYPNV
jgi:hypothetical protein